MRKLTALAGSTALAAAAFAAPPALADPAEPPFDLSCEDGSSYVLTGNRGQGRYTPAFDTASTRVFVPVAFGDAHFVVYNSEGVVIFEGTDPGAPRAGNRTGQGTLECEYSSEFEDVDPELGAIYGTYSGTVVIKTK